MPDKEKIGFIGRERCASFAADGHLGLYKTTKKYDAAVGREQHGYPPPEQLPL